MDTKQYQSIYDDRTKAIRDMVDFTWGIVDFWAKRPLRAKCRSNRRSESPEI
jgi:hypothetical protein